MKYFSGLSNAKSREAHMSYLAREVGNIWRCSSREKGNMINEFKYGQTWNNWPSPLSLSLNSTFKQRIKWNSQVFLFVSFYREGRRIGIAANSSVQTVTKLQTFEEFALCKSVTQSEVTFIVYSEPVESRHLNINFS